jgi:peptide/nickel transport system permease protein
MVFPFVALPQYDGVCHKERKYVEAARVMGEGNLSIALRPLLPNYLSPVIVQATVYLGFTILVIAALVFLDLGAPPPTPDRGYDLHLARDHMETHPYHDFVYTDEEE